MLIRERDGRKIAVVDDSEPTAIMRAGVVAILAWIRTDIWSIK
jgi:hypothetical protein